MSILTAKDLSNMTADQLARLYVLMAEVWGEDDMALDAIKSAGLANCGDSDWADSLAFAKLNAQAFDARSDDSLNPAQKANLWRDASDRFNSAHESIDNGIQSDDSGNYWQ